MTAKSPLLQMLRMDLMGSIHGNRPLKFKPGTALVGMLLLQRQTGPFPFGVPVAQCGHVVVTVALWPVSGIA